MHVKFKDSPRVIAVIKACIGFLITCKIMLSKWLYNFALFMATNTNENLCGWIVKSLIGAGWVYRDGSDYVYLTQFWANPGESYRFRLALIMIAQRMLVGGLRYSWLMNFINSVQRDKSKQVELEFQLYNSSDLSWGELSMIIDKDNDIGLQFTSHETNRPGFFTIYPVEFNVLRFPAGFKEPIPQDPVSVDLTELEASAMINRWKILNKNQDESGASGSESESVSDHKDDGLRQRVVEPETIDT